MVAAAAPAQDAASSEPQKQAVGSVLAGATLAGFEQFGCCSKQSLRLLQFVCAAPVRPAQPKGLAVVTLVPRQAVPAVSQTRQAEIDWQVASQVAVFGGSHASPGWTRPLPQAIAMFWQALAAPAGVPPGLPQVLFAKAVVLSHCSPG